MVGAGSDVGGRAWLRGEVALEHGVLVLDRSTAVAGEPEDGSTLLWEFQAIASDEDALRFARRHGLLRRKPPHVLREPVVAWHAEVGLVQSALGLHADLLAVDEELEGAAEEMREHWLEARRRHGANPDRDVDLDADGADDADADIDVGTPVDEVRDALVRIVARGLEGTHVSFAADEEGRFALVPQPHTLLGLVYHGLAETIASGAPVRRCRECERLFLAEDRRQRYCSERHASRARLRRFRARAAETSQS